MRVQIRNAKGNRGRFVSLPEATLTALRQYSATVQPRHRQALAALKLRRTAMAPRMRAPCARAATKRASCPIPAGIAVEHLGQNQHQDQTIAGCDLG